MDMLASYTAMYTQMIADRNMDSEEFHNCKLMVKHLQKEIEDRQSPSIATEK
jgi:uncharacterized membrane protein (DUF106 family)